MRPPSLKPNDKVAYAAPARKITFEEVGFATRILESWGLQVIIDNRLFRECNQFGGNDEERIDLFQSLLDDEEIKAIICVRGGYGVTRIIDRINFDRFRKNPKWICGYSDITALLCHIQNLGIEGLHCTMPLLFERDTPASLESLRKVIFGQEYYIDAAPHSLNQLGSVEGELVGGNLSILNTIISTSSDVDFTDKILFFEDIDEYLYNIDRMMVHLKRAGKLDLIKGLIVGHMTDMKDNTIPFGLNANEIVSSWIKAYKIPVCYGFPVGHEPINFTIPTGRNGILTVEKQKVSLRF